MKIVDTTTKSSWGGLKKKRHHTERTVTVVTFQPGGTIKTKMLEYDNIGKLNMSNLTIESSYDN